jgi:hypothetical protein
MVRLKRSKRLFLFYVFHVKIVLNMVGKGFLVEEIVGSDAGEGF